MKLDEIGAKIKILRKEKGLTQEQLARLAGISRVTLGKLERSQLGSISLKTIDIILDALGYELDFKSKNAFSLPSLDELY
ncbi:MAG: helix-turn-helix transcriptional regulator [Methylococcales bacterium]